MAAFTRTLPSAGVRSWPDPDGRIGASHRAHWVPADLPVEQDIGAAIRAVAKQLSLSHPWLPMVSHHWVRSQGAEAAKSPPPQSGLSRTRKQIPSQGFPREGFGCRRGRQKVGLR
jgi:hypothetical protein